MYTTEAIVRQEGPFKNSSAITAAYITRAITQADSIIDSSIGDVYVLPLEETPAIIQDLSTKLAIANLLNDQSINIEISAGVSVKGIVDDAMLMLDLILNRKQKLFGADGTELATNSVNRVTSYPTQTSTDDGDTEPLFTIDQDF